MMSFAVPCPSSPDYVDKTPIARDIFVHVCAMLLSFLVIAAEVEYMPIFRQFDFLGNWFGRGVFYYFVGIMTYEADSKGKFSDSAFNRATSISFIAIALFYIVAVRVLLPRLHAAPTARTTTRRDAEARAQQIRPHDLAALALQCHSPHNAAKGATLRKAYPHFLAPFSLLPAHRPYAWTSPLTPSRGSWGCRASREGRTMTFNI